MLFNGEHVGDGTSLSWTLPWTPLTAPRSLPRACSRRQRPVRLSARHDVDAGPAIYMQKPVVPGAVAARSILRHQLRPRCL